MHDAAVCAVLRYAARNRLSHVDAFDLTAMLGLDTDAALERAQRINAKMHDPPCGRVVLCYGWSDSPMSSATRGRSALCRLTGPNPPPTPPRGCHPK
jgi:hypothetical protein